MNKHLKDIYEKAKVLGHLAANEDNYYVCRTVWPLDFFPDTIKIDEHQITLIYRKFFMISEEVDLQISDIMSVEMNAGPLLASLKIHMKYFADPVRNVNWLLKKDAKAVKDIAIRLLQEQKQKEHGEGM